MKKTYNVIIYCNSFDKKSIIPSTIVVTANDEKDVLAFIKEKEKEIMKENNWKIMFANDGHKPIICYEKIEVINL